MILIFEKRSRLDPAPRKLNPGPSGEDTSTSRCRITWFRAGARWSGDHRASEARSPRQTGLLLQSTCTHWDDNVLCVARGCFGAGRELIPIRRVADSPGIPESPAA